MGYEVYKCIDAGSEFCPCHLAEEDSCILCSTLQNKQCSNCNWSGVCIYQRFIDNGKKATKRRNYLKCDLLRKEKIGSELIKLIIKVPSDLSRDLNRPGSFVFLRNPKDSATFDVPIAVMEVNEKKQTISVVLKILGVKTKRLDELIVGQEVIVKGPFWNGILGLRYIHNIKNSTVLIIGRGIGQAPMILPMKELYENNNKIITLIDKGKEGVEFIRPYIDRYSHVNIYCPIVEKGEISKKFIDIFQKIVVNDKVELVHCDTSDYLIKKIISLTEEIERINNHEVSLSCCNNFKMCCGEGICGSCTHSRESNVKRMCKYQGDPVDILKGSE